MTCATIRTEACQTTAWPEHKLVCESLKQARARAIASFEGDGNTTGASSGSASIKQKSKDFVEVLKGVPGLEHRCNFLAWKAGGGPRSIPFTHTAHV